jgi:hypothetical protein
MRRLGHDRPRTLVDSRGRAIGVAALLHVCVAPCAIAADWGAVPRIEVGAYANDNYTLAPDTITPVEVVGAQIRAELDVQANTQLTEFSLRPAIESMRFSGDEDDWDSDDYYLRLDWKHTRERFLAGLRADYADETTVKSELPGSDDDGGGLGEPGGADGGIVAVDNNRQKVTVQPRVSFELTERSTLLADATYTDADYDDESTTGTSGFEDLSGSLGLAFSSSPNSTFSARAIASNYERNVDAVETNSYGVQLEWRSRRSEVAQWYVRVGAEKVDVPSSVVGTDSSSETGFEGGIGTDWSWEVTRVFLDATSAVEPNASGRLVQRNQLRFRLLHQFSPRTSGWVGARLQRDEALVDSTDPFRDRDYATGSLGMEWRFSRDFSLSAQYDARWQEFDDDPSARTSNAFQLSVVYQMRRPE